MNERMTAAEYRAYCGLAPEGKTTKKKRRGMNRMEQEFGMFLRASDGEGAWISYEAITLKLASDTRYTPDWFSIRTNRAGQTLIVAYEVKGWKRDDAMVKLRVAAKAFPWVSFFLVERPKGHGWKITPVPKA